MRRLLVLIIFVNMFLFFSQSILADNTTENKENLLIDRKTLENMSVEELTDLQLLIGEVLIEKGQELYIEIAHGDKGDHVTRLQTQLKKLGYYTGRISGKYDNLTEKAVKAFQKENSLPSSSVATQEMQAILYSAGIEGTKTAAPKKTNTPAPTLDPAYSEYKTIDYRDCARNPEKHLGEKVILSGVVVQVMGTKETGFTVRLRLSGSDIVYLSIGRGIVDYNILEDDRLIVYGTMKGLKTYTSTLKQSITIPQAVADYIILR